MKLIRGIHNIDKAPNKCVLTIGNFDGVHRGHKKLLWELYKNGKKYNLPTVVIIFEPQPMEFFAGTRAPARLMCLREKLYYLAQCKIDYLLCMRFDRYLSTLTAENFIHNLLVKYLGIRFLIVGKDFRFGSDRRGDFLLLQNAGRKYDFDIASIKTLYENGVRISSTFIREVLKKGDLQVAENLLGRPFIISGRVVHGNELGRKIGFPTINIPLHRHVSPIKGVYIVEVIKFSNKPMLGIANIGIRPTIGDNRYQLEVYLFDTTINLYGSYINVIFRKKIRNEQKFTSLDDLKIQIMKDELIAREFFYYRD